MDRIQKELSSDIINQANLGAYTAHQFQGDARDVILVSLCVGPDIPPGSLSYLNQTANLMNVAISRARAVCHVFGNREFVNTCGIPHIAALGRLRKMSADAGNSVGQFESPWEERLFEALFRRGMEPISQYPIAGRRLDIALIKDGIKLDIEIDGEAFHREADGKRKASDLWRDHQLRGLGWHVKRYWVYELKEDMEACVDDILKALNP
jgi:very-short-patch-repair endonuclease